MTEQKQKARWARPKVKPNSSLRDALRQVREAAAGLKAHAADLRAEADALEAREEGSA